MAAITDAKANLLPALYILLMMSMTAFRDKEQIVVGAKDADKAGDHSCQSKRQPT